MDSDEADIPCALASVVRSSLNCIIVVDEVGAITEFNAAAERVFGYPREAMIGRRAGEFIVPSEQRPADRLEIRSFFTSRPPGQMAMRGQVCWRAADGRLVPIEATITEVQLDGRSRFICSLRDLSVEQHTDEELQASRRRLELAVEGAKLGTWTFDLRTGETFYSDRSKQMYGLSPETEMNTEVIRRAVHPDDWKEVSDPYLNGFETDKVEVEYRVICPDGSTRWIYSLGAANRDENGVARTVNGIHLDITDRKVAEAELARSLESLHQSEKLAALGSLLAGVSHELNNPLSAIVGQAEMLEDDSRGTPFEDRAKKISAAADRCARIVQTFLAMARRRPPQRAPIDPNSLVSAALQITEYSLRTSGIAVVAECDPKVPAIEGDRDQLHQVLVNLIINAQQALETGGASDKKLVIRTAVADRSVVIDVRDNGPGVPDSVRSRIFEPFFTTKPQGSGTGVGLSFSQGIVEAHGGTLKILPAAFGASFRIELPAAPALEAMLDEGGSLAPSAVPGKARRTALLVDDEPDVAETLAELLGREGFDVALAADGAAALDRLRGQTFDVILSDLRMPGVSGPDFYSRLIESSPEAAARVAFVTGDTLGTSMEAFLDGSGRPVLEKPFTAEGVRALVRQLLPEEPGR